MKPRVLLVGRNRFRLPLTPSLKRKFDALGEVVELRVLGTAADGVRRRDGIFILVSAFPVGALDGVWFYVALPFRVARELRRQPAEAVLTQSPYEAAAVLLARRLAGVPVRIVLEVHGDWRTLTRLYGSRGRRLIRSLADAIAATAVRRAEAVRTVSPYTTALVRELGVSPTAEFPAFMDLEPFLERPPDPLPAHPRALFIGVLEAYKNVDGLAAAWRQAAPRVPGAVLQIVGRGSRTDVVERLLADVPGQTEWSPILSTAEVAAALDSATVLVLPSRSEGMGRVIVEALARGRPVLGTRVGGIADLIEHGSNGLLVELEPTSELAGALVRILSEPELAERLARAARPSVERWLATPEEYARRIRNVVDDAVNRS